MFRMHFQPATHTRPTDAGSDTLANVEIMPPLPLRNDPEERWKAGMISNRLFTWSVDAVGYKIDDELVSAEDGAIYRVRATKPWPDETPVYWELHLDKENA